MENINSIEIPFTSSHDCTVEITYAGYTDYNVTGKPTGETKYGENSSGEYYTPDSFKGERPFTAVVNGTQDGFILTHDLNNDFENSSNKWYDVSKITIKVSVKHSTSDEHGNYYQKDFTITQTPAIIIDVEPNEYENYKGYRYVNNTDYNNIPSNLGGFYGPDTWTRNMYKIQVTSLPEGSDYIIGDPRTQSAWSWTSNPQPISAPSLTGGGNRSIQNYFPARDDRSADNVISPLFRTSSAWSRCNGGSSYDVIKKRAAAYQEAGYPAGRWRLLTEAEAKFISKLSKDGKIPELLSTTYSYFYAGGFIKNGSTTRSTTTGENNGVGSARLAYDEWYWDNIPDQYKKCPVNQFTWGDMPRQ